MAAPCCDICALMGYRSCNLCGGVVFRPHGLLGDVCTYCLGQVDEDDTPKARNRPAEGEGGTKSPRP